ncbi:N-6 DNA methylase [Peptoniphilus sp. KCTC 25270]|nr:N-6 DNA methylase [Peptoniphilus sp. KCTC 25270]
MSNRSKVEKNDILFGMIGTIGNPVIVKENNFFSIKNVGLFKKNEDLINPKYLYYYLSSWFVEKIMLDQELIRGTTQKFIALGGLRMLPIPLPSIDEQEEIIKEIESRLSVCENIEANIEEALEKAEALRQSILKKAFEGKLLSKEELEACRQEDDWEPAGLLEKNAEDTKSGAGQYFTPRALIRAMVTCVQPEPIKTIVDPACGTGGFFLASYDYISQGHDLNRDEKEFLKNKTFHGNEIVANTRRLCLMNMFLHNIGEMDGETFISSADALIADEGNRYDYVLANPPFGKKSSMTITNEEGEQVKEDLVYNRQDFWVTTSNKQLNFLQHIRTLLKENGQAAVVLPDNVLFEGGAGETVRKELLKTTDLYTILRLPIGIFYRPGVKANVLFFDNKPGARDPWTKEIWFYDYRTNVHHTLKKKPMEFEDLEDFIKCYNPSNRHDRQETWSEENPEGRWRKYSYEEIIERDKTSLDIFWLKDDSLTDLENLPDPDILANEIIENIEAGLESFQALMETLKGE